MLKLKLRPISHCTHNSSRDFRALVEHDTCVEFSLVTRMHFDGKSECVFQIPLQEEMQSVSVACEHRAHAHTRATLPAA
jgi:hypothetical protein